MGISFNIFLLLLLSAEHILAAVVVRTPTYDKCALLKKVKPGNYTALKDFQGTSITLSTFCPSLKCKKTGLKQIHFERLNKSAFFTFDKSEMLFTFSQSKNLRAKVVRKNRKFILKTKNLNFVLRYKKKGKTLKYILTISIINPNNVNGFLNEILRENTKRGTNRLPNVCKGNNVQFAGVLRQKQIRKYT